VRVEESFDVCDVARPRRDGLHHDQIFDRSKPKGDAPDAAFHRSVDHFALERQARQRAEGEESRELAIRGQRDVLGHPGPSEEGGGYAADDGGRHIGRVNPRGDRPDRLQ
jgi:hypothetical protein